jgi:putative ABC transport system permease protein
VRLAWARVVAAFRKHDLDREFDEEVRSHIALATEDYMQRGVPRAEAQRMARVKFGAVEASKDAHRDSRGLAWLESIFYDLRFAFRDLRRDRAFTITAITMLALAIGLNVTVFAVMNTMLFRGFSLVKKNSRLAYIEEHSPSAGCCSYPDFEDWRAQTRSFEGMAFIGEKPISFSDGGGERPVDTLAFTVSSNTLELLGVHPFLGRDFVPADQEPGAPPVALLSYRSWELRFGKFPDIVGHIVRINNVPATVIGVMPSGFDFPVQEDLWMPLTLTAELQHRGPGGPPAYFAFGRLTEGATLAGAQAELDAINRRLAASYPATNRDVVLSLESYSKFFIGPNASVIYGSLWAAGWFVLLIACANLANLTLARTLGRSREFSIRIALGAGRWRMVRQILTESLLLAGASGALGWWIATWSVRTWAAATASRYQVLDYALDEGTLTYLIAISIAAALLCAGVPIGRLLKLEVNGTLKGGARTATQGRRSKGLSTALVAGQMALAIVLLSGAGVLVRSLLTVVGAPTGVSDPENVLIGSMVLPSEKYRNSEARLRYFGRLEEQLKTIPGIQGESLSNTIPLNSGLSRTFEIEGQDNPPDGGESTQFLTVGSDYFRVVQAPVISGRAFNDGDHMSTLPVAIVNESFAARFWPGEQALGKHLRVKDRNTRGEWRTVIGVVPNIMQGDPLRQHFKPLVYAPFRQEPATRAQNSDGAGFNGAYFLLRTSVPSRQVAQVVRAEVQKLDTDVILQEFTNLSASFAFRRDRMDLEHAELGKYGEAAPIFALIALLLAAIGLYAVVAHSVNQRTKEIGVRVAIGATRESIRNMVLRDGMLPVVAGMILGLAASLAVNRTLQSQLVGVSPYDPATVIGAPVILILVALIACHIPSRRAVRVDPVVALRQD